MQTTTFVSSGDWPKAPKGSPSASWPRYKKNAETRDHLGSGLIDYSQKMTMAAIQIADMNV